MFDKMYIIPVDTSEEIFQTIQEKPFNFKGYTKEKGSELAMRMNLNEDKDKTKEEVIEDIPEELPEELEEVKGSEREIEGKTPEVIEAGGTDEEDKEVELADEIKKNFETKQKGQEDNEVTKQLKLFVDKVKSFVSTIDAQQKWEYDILDLNSNLKILEGNPDYRTLLYKQSENENNSRIEVKYVKIEENKSISEGEKEFVDIEEFVSYVKGLKQVIISNGTDGTIIKSSKKPKLFVYYYIYNGYELYVKNEEGKEIKLKDFVSFVDLISYYKILASKIKGLKWAKGQSLKNVLTKQNLEKETINAIRNKKGQISANDLVKARFKRMKELYDKYGDAKSYEKTLKAQKKEVVEVIEQVEKEVKEEKGKVVKELTSNNEEQETINKTAEKKIEKVTEKVEAISEAVIEGIENSGQKKVSKAKFRKLRTEVKKEITKIKQEMINLSFNKVLASSKLQKEYLELKNKSDKTEQEKNRIKQIRKTINKRIESRADTLFKKLSASLKQLVRMFNVAVENNIKDYSTISKLAGSVVPASSAFMRQIFIVDNSKEPKDNPNFRDVTKDEVEKSQVRVKQSFESGEKEHGFITIVKQKVEDETHPRFVAWILFFNELSKTMQGNAWIPVLYGDKLVPPSKPKDHTGKTIQEQLVKAVSTGNWLDGFVFIGKLGVEEYLKEIRQGTAVGSEIEEEVVMPPSNPVQAVELESKLEKTQEKEIEANDKKTVKVSDLVQGVKSKEQKEEDSVEKQTEEEQKEEGSEALPPSEQAKEQVKKEIVSSFTPEQKEEFEELPKDYQDDIIIKMMNTKKHWERVAPEIALTLTDKIENIEEYAKAYETTVLQKYSDVLKQSGSYVSVTADEVTYRYYKVTWAFGTKSQLLSFPGSEHSPRFFKNFVKSFGKKYAIYVVDPAHNTRAKRISNGKFTGTERIMVYIERSFSVHIYFKDESGKRLNGLSLNTYKKYDDAIEFVEEIIHKFPNVKYIKGKDIPTLSGGNIYEGGGAGMSVSGGGIEGYSVASTTLPSGWWDIYDKKKRLAKAREIPVMDEQKGY